MKNALIAFDKFKDALTAHQACEAAASALAQAQPSWQIATSPLADGGDGFCDTLTRLCDGEFLDCQVRGPLGQTTTARYGLVETARISAAAAQRLALPDSLQTLAIVEFAQSSGIALVPQEQRSPWTTTSYGLGQTIAHAQERGAQAILVGLGGSATNDLALGALQALGYRFLDSQGQDIDTCAAPETWQQIARIQAPDARFDLPLRIACDVENPLLGENGATAVFGPQKGLKPEDFPTLEAEMKRLAALLCHATDADLSTMATPGSGAAGGAAFGLMLGLGGQLVQGAELVFDWSDLHSKLDAADLVITGEGRFDASSLQGKGPGSLATLCLDRNKELLVLAGSLGTLPNSELASKARAITPPGTPLPQAIAETESNIRAAIAQELSP
ncbi:glycerate kinase [Pelagicoccus sp. SDUM812005]|uniref:glycerate kinase family protein n=1 Tax=Pelagicoccus sp. SDUM812005 TaxID=3041257 RepID=UPI00280DA487|nr:glycerate kinase [Pelagicoccus sp. SDUM812005]MDQ8183357.1 glycerate kinase [Pelagicoccus sp. SDUM812005]